MERYADRIVALAEESATNDHPVSAREAYLRASNYYRTSYFPLYGAPPNERLIAAFEKEAELFQKAAALFDPSIESVEIPYQGTTLPGFFYRVDDSDQPRPTLIATNGYDSTIQEMHFAHTVAAVRRGYNCLLFDGPGQGRALIKQDLHMRPDWENVVTPVIDYAVDQPEVDSDRIALVGWSFGGYLAPRAASGNQRLAACIADPGQWDMLESVKAMLDQFGIAQEVIEASSDLRWRFIQRGLWVHGLDSLMEYFRVAPEYSLKECAGEIECPTLVTQAENDPVAAFADGLYAVLDCPTQLIRFTNEEGAGDHDQ